MCVLNDNILAYKESEEYQQQLRQKLHQLAQPLRALPAAEPSDSNSNVNVNGNGNIFSRFSYIDEEAAAAAVAASSSSSAFSSSGKTSTLDSTNARASLGQKSGSAVIDLTVDDEDNRDEEEEEEEDGESGDDGDVGRGTTIATSSASASANANVSSASATPSMTLAQALALNAATRERAGKPSKSHNTKVIEQLHITTGEPLRIYPTGGSGENNNYYITNPNLTLSLTAAHLSHRFWRKQLHH